MAGAWDSVGSADYGIGRAAAGGSPGPDLRAPILASWERCRRQGLDGRLVELPYLPDLDSEEQLLLASGPVVERLHTALAGTRQNVLLTDGTARVLVRRTAEASHSRGLDAVQLAPGFSYAEGVAGTNAIGTVLMEKRPCNVLGSEHFVDRLKSFTCSAAPIREPDHRGDPRRRRPHLSAPGLQPDDVGPGPGGRRRHRAAALRAVQPSRAGAAGERPADRGRRPEPGPAGPGRPGAAPRPGGRAGGQGQAGRRRGAALARTQSRAGLPAGRRARGPDCPRGRGQPRRRRGRPAPVHRRPAAGRARGFDVGEAAGTGPGAGAGTAGRPAADGRRPRRRQAGRGRPAAAGPALRRRAEHRHHPGHVGHRRGVHRSRRSQIRPVRHRRPGRLGAGRRRVRPRRRAQAPARCRTGAARRRGRSAEQPLAGPGPSA